MAIGFIGFGCKIVQPKMPKSLRRFKVLEIIVGVSSNIDWKKSCEGPCLRSPYRSGRTNHQSNKKAIGIRPDLIACLMFTTHILKFLDSKLLEIPNFQSKDIVVLVKVFDMVGGK